MQRRDFIKKSGSVMVAGILTENALSQALSSSPQSATAGRLVFPINRNWRYGRSFAEGTQAKDFDDSKFETVVVPHTNAKLPWHGFDEKTYEFVSIYRRHFNLPSEARAKRVFVDFEGVTAASTVWINGVRLGEYKGGYTPFSFELTPHLDFDKENVLAVAVDSTERADIPPFGYEIDYLTFGGIYREVSLRIVSPAFLENIFAQPRDVLSGHPTLDVQCFLQHEEHGSSDAALTLEAALYDGDRLVAKSTQAAASDESQTLHLDDLGAIQL